MYLTTLVNLYLNNVMVRRRPLKSGVFPVHGGIANTDSTMTLQYSLKLTQLATLRESSVGEGWVGVKVPVFNFGAFLERYKIVDNIKLLKIDCEGCEFSLVPSIGTDKNILYCVFKSKSYISL